jgi:hypothetical protein
VRPGTVFRLYSKKLYDSFKDHQDAEIHRKPLHEVVINLHTIFDGAEDFTGVCPILNQVLEPPEEKKVIESFNFLNTERILKRSIRQFRVGTQT